MEYKHLNESVNIKTIEEDAYKGVFEVEGLYTGYGLTVGNALRRTLLSSLPGAAVTQIKINNVPHEFSTLPGVKEDMVQLGLNFKQLRFRMHTDELQTLELHVKGEQTITGADIKTNSEVEIMNPEIELAHLTAKSAEITIEIQVERGLGYSAVEARKSEKKLAIGAIALDAMFTPVTTVNYTVDSMRVGERTDFDRLRLEIETDGTISPSSALHKASNILKDHFEKVSNVTPQEFEVAVETKKKKTSKK